MTTISDIRTAAKIKKVKKRTLFFISKFTLKRFAVKIRKVKKKSLLFISGYRIRAFAFLQTLFEKGKKRVLSFISKLNVLKKHLKSALVFLLLLFLWIIFENKLMNLFDEFILPVFSLMTFSKFSTVLFLFIVFPCFVYGTWRIWKYRYQMPLLTMLMLSGGVAIYARLRFSGDYVSIPNLLWNLGYSDIFMICLSILLLFLWFLFLFPKKKETSNYSTLLLDTPIDKLESDILDYSESAQKLASELESINTEFPYSVGLIAPWGTGKTSYLNLLNNYLDRDKFIVVKFNPRHSQSSKNIQEDFFESLFSELSKYDSRFSSSFIDYLKAINVFAENKTISTFLGIHKLWNKNSERDRINNAIRRIDKRIVIIIDDFDRLLADEIVEIFKLIDGNASFTNFIFITAYDKGYINDIIEKKYHNADSSFSDKFFTIEIQIPLRPYEKIYNYLVTNLLKNSVIDETKRSVIEKHHQTDLLKKYIFTLRDAKRFYNTLVWQYNSIQNDVVFEDYFLLCLIKYRHFDEYVILRNMKEKYISIDYFKSTSRYFLNKHFLEPPKSKDVLDLLFSEATNSELFSICNVNTFETYFYEKVYNGIPADNMNTIFSLSLDKSLQFIDKSVSDNKFNYILTFLDSKTLLDFNSKNDFERFLDLLFYINCKKYDVGIPYITIFKLLYTDNKQGLLEKYSYDENGYKDLVSKKLIGVYPNYPDNITKGIITGIINKEFPEEIIFTKEEILVIAKNTLDNLIENDNEVKQLHIELLYSCISAIDPTTRQITLDKEACSKIKKLIDEKPAGYFDNFVRLGRLSLTPDFNSIACEPFWEQIFGNKEAMGAFIGTNQSTIPKIRLINNFWKLYQNNNYKPIEFERQGDVSEKINNNLEGEVNDLNTLLDIERQFDELEDDRGKSPREKDNEVYRKKYNAFLNQVNSIHLYINKRIEIIRKIELAIKSME